MSVVFYPEGGSKVMKESVALSEAGRYREALALLHPLLKESPEDEVLLCLLSINCYLEREFTEAQKYAEDAIRHAPEYAWGHRLRSTLLRIKKEKESSIPAEAAVKLTSEGRFAYLNLYELQMAEGKFAQALKTAQRLVEVAPNFDLAYQALGEVLISRTQPKKAEEAYRQGLAVNPLSDYGHAGLASALAHQKRYPEAVELLLKAVHLNPLNIHHSQHLFSVVQNACDPRPIYVVWVTVGVAIIVGAVGLGIKFGTLYFFPTFDERPLDALLYLSLLILVPLWAFTLWHSRKRSWDALSPETQELYHSFGRHAATHLRPLL